jgi:hypothetical protein
VWPAAALGWAPVSYTLVYAPRDAAEAAVFRTILAASWAYSAGDHWKPLHAASSGLNQSRIEGGI